MSGGSGNNRREMRWKCLRRRPLIESSVRPTPHCHLTVAKRLSSKPFDYVMSVPWLVCKRLELAARVSTTAHVDQREGVTIRGEIRGALMICVRNIRCQCEDYRRFWE